MPIKYLRRTQRRRQSGGSTKFRLPCQSMADDPASRETWLQVRGALLDENPLLKGFLDRSKEVVIKHDTVQNTEKDYLIAEALFDNKCPNIIKYFCKFTCDDSVNVDDRGKQVNAAGKTFICDGKGGPRGFVVMSFYPMGSVIDRRWERRDLGLLKDIARQALFAYLHAHMETGFVHGDFHAGNVIVRATKKKTVQYGSLAKLPTGGTYAMIMDFGKSSFNRLNLKQVYEDVNRFLHTMARADASDIVLDYNDSPVRTLRSRETPVAKDVFYTIAKVIQDITISHSKSELNARVASGMR